MIKAISSKALRLFWEKDDRSGIKPDWIKRVSLVLDALDVADTPEELRLPGLRLHPLKGDRAGTYAVTVSRNWRITFRWEDGDAVDVELEDYHG